MRGDQKTIQFGDSQLEWNDNFRLYLITKISNPKFSPETTGKTMVINYTVTLKVCIHAQYAMSTLFICLFDYLIRVIRVIRVI